MCPNGSVDVDVEQWNYQHADLGHDLVVDLVVFENLSYGNNESFEVAMISWEAMLWSWRTHKIEPRAFVPQY